METLLLFKTMVNAVLSVHRKRICHRDLKPSNFLIKGGKLYLSDLGTAKKMDGVAPDIRQAYVLPVGDWRYTAPENFLSLGIGDDYVYTADFFSLGAILFEMFTGAILSNEIYNPEFIKRTEFARPVLSRQATGTKVETYKGIVDDIAKAISLPNIYSYNNYVPSGIKIQLDKLYKDLCSINLFKRINSQDHTSLHRRIDICILILRNEIKDKQRRAYRKKKVS